VVVPEIDDPFFMDVVRVTQVPLRTAGYSQLVIDTGNSTELEWDLLQSLRDSVDGVILAASRLPDEKLREIADVLPLVALNRSTDGVACVLIDTQSGTVQALEHLVSLGHRRIGYVGGPLSSWSSASRLRALEERSTELGVEIVPVGTFEAKITSGAAAADIAVNAGVTACICFGDLIAIGMLQRFRDQDVRVPSDFSVVGCDDTFGADFCAPPLTTLTVPTEQATRAAMNMLLTEIGATDNEPARATTILQAHLTIRESTGQSPRFPRQRAGWAAFAEADADALSRASDTALLSAPRGHQPGA
jgi:LacI family transcriptional regulator